MRVVPSFRIPVAAVASLEPLPAVGESWVAPKFSFHSPREHRN